MNGQQLALDSGLDRWLQRGAVAAMVAIAIGLMAIGVSLYARPAHAAEAPVGIEAASH